MKINKNSYFKLFIRFYILILIGLNSPATAGIGMCDNLFSELRLELGLPVIVVNTLRKRGINTVKKLASKTEEELLKLPFFSTEYLREVETALAKKNLALKKASLKVPSKQNLSLSSTKNLISSLDLSNRAKNTLLAKGINTVEVLSSKTEQELLLIPNFGKIALKEVKQALAERNLTLKLSSLEVIPNRSLSLIGIKNPITSLDLSNKAKNALLAEGINTVEMLSSKTEQELLLIPNFGKTTLKKVEQALAKRDLTLRDPHLDLNSILSLSLSHRTENALRKETIHTIEELTSKTEQELMWMPNFGKTALEEVKQALAKRGLALSKARPNLDSILSLGISAYSSKILQTEGIKTVEELAGKTKQELMKLPYLSQRALWEIELSLAKKGLYLRDTTIN